jgi:hypothetical protein
MARFNTSDGLQTPLSPHSLPDFTLAYCLLSWMAHFIYTRLSFAIKYVQRWNYASLRHKTLNILMLCYIIFCYLGHFLKGFMQGAQDFTKRCYYWWLIWFCTPHSNFLLNSGLEVGLGPKAKIDQIVFVFFQFSFTSRPLYLSTFNSD